MSIRKNRLKNSLKNVHYAENYYLFLWILKGTYFTKSYISLIINIIRVN